MQSIEELTSPPVVGRHYWVPTIEHEWDSMDGVWPVIGPMHEDAEIIKFPHPHYHLDGRFLSAVQRRHADGLLFSMAKKLASLPMVANWAGMRGDVLPPLVRRRRRCSASSLPYLSETGYIIEGTFIEKLRAAFAGRRLIESRCGWVCPHRGAALGSIPPDANGVITCPLHGLQWKANSGCSAAQGIEARRAETLLSGSVHEHATRRDAP